MQVPGQASSCCSQLGSTHRRLGMNDMHGLRSCMARMYAGSVLVPQVSCPLQGVTAVHATGPQGLIDCEQGAIECSALRLEGQAAVVQAARSYSAWFSTRREEGSQSPAQASAALCSLCSGLPFCTSSKFAHSPGAASSQCLPELQQPAVKVRVAHRSPRLVTSNPKLARAAAPLLTQQACPYSRLQCATICDAL